MQCHKCGYSLWNIASRECPECGETFKPSDYQFKPDAVVYCCPQCQQGYHKTDNEGYLTPREQYCTQCGHYMFMNRMILKPACGNVNQVFYINQNPWVSHETGSIRTHAKAWWQTTKLSMFRPEVLCVESDPREPIGHGWGYYILHLFTVTFLSFSTLAVVYYYSRQIGLLTSVQNLLPVAVLQACVAFAAVFLGSIACVISSLPLHLVLRLLGLKNVAGIRRFNVFSFPVV